MIGHSMGKTKKDNTEVMRVRQSVGSNKLFSILLAVLALIGVIGWLTSL